MAAREGWTASAIIPIRVENRLEALLALYFDRPLDDLPLGQRELERIGSIASISLTNFWLRSRLEQAAAAERTLTEEQATLTALTLVADAAPELAPLAATTLNQIVLYLGAAGGAYALISDDDQLTHVAHVGVDADWVGQIKGVPASSMTPVQRMGAGGGPYLQPYVEGGAKPINLERARARGYTAYAALPIRVDDRLAGLITVWFTRPVETIAWHERAVAAMARIAGFSLANFRLRERLSASESLYRTLFESSPDAVILLSSSSNVIAANRAALELYRTDLESLRNFSAAEGTVDQAEWLRRAAILALEGRATFRGTERRPDGTEFPAQVDIALVALGGEQQSLMLVRDLTDQGRFQRELLQAQKMEAIGQLVSGVAHELNNPLASIIAFSQLIRRDERLPQDLRGDAELLTQEADRTRRIVQNLLDFARRRPPERVPTSTRALVDSGLALQSYSLASGRIAVEVDIGADLPTIAVDRSQLQQVLLNLTLNAIQAIRSNDAVESSGSAGPAGTIRITASQVAGPNGSPAIQIAIMDDGPGVPPESRSGLFVPFFTTKEPGEGTGLGLPVSFGIVAAHGGHLWYEPGPGGVGARFVFELPVRGVAAAATQRATGREPLESVAPEDPPRSDPAERLRDRSAPATVLVLDDEPAIRGFLTKALKLGQFEPIVARRGLEALDLVRRRTFDAVLVDHRMPGMSGTDVYEAVVAIRPELASRFVFMSGDVLNPGLREFAEQRHVLLLAKPFDVDTVLRVVADIVDQGRSRG
ncbi:MAG: PAS domain S-box protein [Chloroflexi bacterium]|nr:PAS domain S-box protein [Chloroflexota bacterium]